MANQFFARKPLALLLEEMRGENRLRRILGPVQLTALGVGAIIGAGIFVATGAAAHNVGGPALMVSYVVAGITCVFAALCYAEFASMVPVAGSAYTYAYATLGELFAWIIGWDLVLEYAVGSATVATGWSGYFQNVLQKVGVQLPLAFRESPWRYDAAAGHFLSTGSYFNLPAILVVAVVTAILVKGIAESASFNATMVGIKIAAVLFVIGVGVFFINTENWHPFAPFGWSGISFFGHHVAGKTDPGGSPVGMLAGAAIIFFAYIGFDSVSTHTEEAKNPQRDVPIGIITSLVVCTVLYIAVVAVLTGDGNTLHALGGQGGNHAASHAVVGSNYSIHLATGLGQDLFHVLLGSFRLPVIGVLFTNNLDVALFDGSIQHFLLACAQQVGVRIGGGTLDHGVVALGLGSEDGLSLQTSNFLVVEREIEHLWGFKQAVIGDHGDALGLGLGQRRCNRILVLGQNHQHFCALVDQAVDVGELLLGRRLCISCDVGGAMLGQLVLDGLLICCPTLFAEVGPAHPDQLCHHRSACCGYHCGQNYRTFNFHTSLQK